MKQIVRVYLEMTHLIQRAQIPKFNPTLIQKLILKDRFWVLWRKILWANSAPIQPPARLKKCKVRSEIRREFVRAQFLSHA